MPPTPTITTSASAGNLEGLFVIAYYVFLKFYILSFDNKLRKYNCPTKLNVLIRHIDIFTQRVKYRSKKIMKKTGFENNRKII